MIRLTRVWSLAAVLVVALGTAAVRAEDTDPPADAADDAAKAAMEAFKSSYKGDDDAKVNALEKLAETRHQKVFGLFSGLLMGKENDLIKQTAARALGSYKDKRVAPMLSKAFEAVKKEPKVLEAVIIAMGETGDLSLAETLGKFAVSKGSGLDKKTVDTSYMAVETLGKLRCRESMESLLKLGDALNGMTNLDSEKSSMRSEMMNRVVGALKAVTEQDLKDDDTGKIITRYKKWWKANEKTWDPNKKPDPEKKDDEKKS